MLITDFKFGFLVTSLHWLSESTFFKSDINIDPIKSEIWFLQEVFTGSRDEHKHEKPWKSWEAKNSLKESDI